MQEKIKTTGVIIEIPDEIKIQLDTEFKKTKTKNKGRQGAWLLKYALIGLKQAGINIDTKQLI